MSNDAPVLGVQQGIWVGEQWLQSAELSFCLEVIVQSDEIRIIAAPTKVESQSPSAKGRSVSVL